MSDSLLLWYSLVETSRNIGIDTLNKKYNMKNNEVYSVMDENYGFVAEFKEKSFLNIYYGYKAGKRKMVPCMYFNLRKYGIYIYKWKSDRKNGNGNIYN